MKVKLSPMLGLMVHNYRMAKAGNPGWSHFNLRRAALVISRQRRREHRGTL
jgi:hypothetical protein